MTWTKLSDDFPDDCCTLSDAAFRLHVEGLVWSNRKLLDLELSKDDLPRWATHPEAVDELVESGYWTDEGQHVLIRHHGCYQRTREQVQKQQEANKRNRAKGRARPVREQANGIHETQQVDDSFDDSSDERDGTGQARPGEDDQQPNVSENGETNHAEPFTPTAEQLRRIDANIRRGYEQ